MIKAILIDDEVHCLDTLSMLITDFCPEVQLMEQCHSAKAGTGCCSQTSAGNYLSGY